MDKILMEGGVRLEGRVRISGAKNAALPLLAATILVDGTVTYQNVPNLRDVTTMFKALHALGVVSYADDEGYHIDATKLNGFEAPYELVKTMRASILVLGPLLARLGKARVSLPGGAPSGRVPSTCTSWAWKKWAPRSPSNTGMCRPKENCTARKSRLTSPRSPAPRTSSWPPRWRRASPPCVTPQGSRKSAIWPAP